MKCKVCALPTWVIICEFPSPFARIRKLPWWSPSSLPVEVAKEWDAHAEGWISGESTWRQFFRFRGSVCCGWMLCWTRRILLVTWSNHGGEILGATKKKNGNLVKPSDDGFHTIVQKTCIYSICLWIPGGPSWLLFELSCQMCTFIPLDLLVHHTKS